MERSMFEISVRWVFPRVLKNPSSRGILSLLHYLHVCFFQRWLPRGRVLEVIVSLFYSILFAWDVAVLFHYGGRPRSGLLCK